MGYELFIGLRYLKAKRKQTFISVITAISVLGITVGVMALIIVLSVMNGFEEDLKEKILGVNAHMVVMEVGSGMGDYSRVAEEIRQVDGVVGVTPYTYNQAMLSARGGVLGVVLRGLDVETAGEVTVINERIIDGSLDGLKQRFFGPDSSGAEGLPGIVIGSELARSLSLNVGDELKIISPMATSSPLGSVPRMAGFTVAGVFEMGMYEYDSSMVFISIENAQGFFKLGDSVTGIEVKIDDIYDAEQVRKNLIEEVDGPYWVRTWMDMNRNLFSALKLEKVAMFIILTLIIVVAALNIISTLIMVVMEKNKDIAILKSMGATATSIMKIFMIEGLIIGFVGTSLGTLLGVVTALKLDELVSFIEGLFNFTLLPPSVYYIDKMPSEVEPTVVILIALLSITISFVATIYPAWQASKLDPVEGLRYE